MDISNDDLLEARAIPSVITKEMKTQIEDTAKGVASIVQLEAGARIIDRTTKMKEKEDLVWGLQIQIKNLADKISLDSSTQLSSLSDSLNKIASIIKIRATDLNEHDSEETSAILGQISLTANSLATISKTKQTEVSTTASILGIIKTWADMVDNIDKGDTAKSKSANSLIVNSISLNSPAGCTIIDSTVSQGNKKLLDYFKNKNQESP